jgi:hypothetical protein
VAAILLSPFEARRRPRESNRDCYPDLTRRYLFLARDRLGSRVNAELGEHSGDVMVHGLLG